MVLSRLMSDIWGPKNGKRRVLCGTVDDVRDSGVARNGESRHVLKRTGEDTKEVSYTNVQGIEESLI